MTNQESAVESTTAGWRFDNTYATLPEAFHAPALPAKVRRPRLVLLNERLAAELGLNFSQLPADELAATFAGQTLPPGSQPIAQAYAGHQFGGFTMLGDGRAILLGEHKTPSGDLVDIQFKGSGQTVFSRRGDGRAALGPMLREYVISEAMSALGIPTTRSLAVVTTGEPVYRETIRKGAILTRVAASHIRVGTFEYAATQRDVALLKTLADYAIARHYPELTAASEKYLAFLRAMMDRQASLVAKWQLVGFIHGVMNTDNMAISGETIDYGPCAFMNAFDPATVFSSIDHGGRYAYGNQPAIAQWNLARFAESLLPLLHTDENESIAIATEALQEFPTLFTGHWLAGMRKKLGLRSAKADDEQLIGRLLSWMYKAHADFTNTFRNLSSETLPQNALFEDEEFQSWRRAWQHRLQEEGGFGPNVVAAMREANPAVIPRNHKVEEGLAAAEEQDDLTVIQRLLAAVTSPFDPPPGSEAYQTPPADERGYRTFCGT